MKKTQIATAALNCFAANGYEGTSLAQIAAAVGLKKQSLYAHFADKDAIFLAALNHSKAEEITFYEDFFMKQFNSFAETLQQLLRAMRQHFYTSNTQQFWLRMSFYPPPHLRDIVDNEVKDLYTTTENFLLPLFIKHQHLLAVMPREATDSFTALINAIIVEVLYATPEDVFQRKFSAMWRVFERGSFN